MPSAHDQRRSAPGGALAAGAVLGDRFIILDELGRGARGPVYRARDRYLDQQVALRVLACDREHDPGRFEALRREVGLARSITHPSVCRLHDLDEAQGCLFVTMELVEGESLARRLQRAGPLPPDEVSRIGHQVAAALAAAHAVGVAHRELHPANVMLAAGGRVVLMDLGLGGTTSDEPGAPADDVYDLGRLLYALACGRLPEARPADPGASPREAPDPRRERGDLPERLGRVIRRCLAPRPADRYPTALDVGLELATGASWVRAASRPGNPPLPTARRRRWLWGALALLLVVGGGAAAVTLLGGRPEGPVAVPRLVVTSAPASPADPRGRRRAHAVRRRVARELRELGRAATDEESPPPRVGTVAVRATRTAAEFRLGAEVVAGDRRWHREGRGPTLAAAAAALAGSIAAVVRTPEPEPSAATRRRFGAATAAAARELVLAEAAVEGRNRERVRRHVARALALEPGLVAPHLLAAAAEESYTAASRAPIRRAVAAARGRDDLMSRLARAWARNELDGEDRAANAALGAVYATHPDDPLVAYRYADSLGDVWQVERANAILERLLEGRPAHVPAMLRLFDLRLTHGEHEQLLRDGARIVARAPEEPDAYVIQARSLLANGRLDEALAALEAALDLAPDHGDALTFQARVLLFRGDLAAARAVATRLRRGSPRRQGAALRSLGLADILEGHFAAGIRHLEESLRASPEEAADAMLAHKVIVYTLEDVGDYAAALAAARRWEEHALRATYWSQVVYARQEQDTCRFRLGRLTREQFRARLPRYLAEMRERAGYDVFAGQGPTLSVWHGYVLGEYRAAMVAALKDEVPAMYTQFLIAECYAHLGEPERAVEWYQRIFAHPDEDLIPTLLVRARLRLADALDALGRHDEARVAYAAFVSSWAGADRPLPDVARARRRLAAGPPPGRSARR